MSRSIIKEIWRDIPEYEGLYQVSNFGNVRSLRDWNGNSSKPSYYQRIHVMKPTDNGSGYLIVSLRKDTIRKNHYVHRLVAEAFVPNPSRAKYVNHLDYDRKNNSADNLQWCTQKENVRYSSCRMKHLHNCAPSKSTGERYIRAKDGKYELTISGKYIGRFGTLEKAVERRDALLKEVI